MIQEMKATWVKPWSPTNCNYCLWYGTKRGLRLEYSPLTFLTPSSKMLRDRLRKQAGLIPVWAGDKHHPTSRVRFDPSYTNDRYFR